MDFQPIQTLAGESSRHQCKLSGENLKKKLTTKTSPFPLDVLNLTLTTQELYIGRNSSLRETPLIQIQKQCGPHNHPHSSSFEFIIRLGTHVISAILNVGQKVDRDWPLHIQDNQGNHHQVCSMVMMMTITVEMITIGIGLSEFQTTRATIIKFTKQE